MLENYWYFLFHRPSAWCQRRPSHPRSQVAVRCLRVIFAKSCKIDFLPYFRVFRLILLIFRSTGARCADTPALSGCPRPRSTVPSGCSGPIYLWIVPALTSRFDRPKSPRCASSSCHVTIFFLILKFLFIEPEKKLIKNLEKIFFIFLFVIY